MEAQHPVVSSVHRVNAKRYARNGALEISAVLMCHLGGIVFGAIVNHEYFVTGTKRVQRAAQAERVIMSV